MSIHTRRNLLSWIMASLVVGAFSWQFFLKPVWPGLKPPPTLNAPTATPTPDMRIYQLRDAAWWHISVKRGEETTVEELEALMGKPDHIGTDKEIVGWYYVIEPSDLDVWFWIKDGKVDTLSKGPITRNTQKVRAEKTKTYILESMKIIQLEKEEPVKQLTRQYRLEQEDDRP